MKGETRKCLCERPSGYFHIHTYTHKHTTHTHTFTHKYSFFLVFFRFTANDKKCYGAVSSMLSN